MRVLGFMSGTSLDAVDMAVLETDGETIFEFGPSGEAPMRPDVRRLVLAAIEAARTWPRGAPPPEVFAAASKAVAEMHLEAGQAFLKTHGLAAASIDLAGFHGQTVLHERPQLGRPGRTLQLGDASLLAAGLQIPVAFDFRSADVAAGGEGAPLAPVYHQARLWSAGRREAAAVLNLGGVANITVSRADGTLEAFDTGPANGMIDLLMQARTAERFDRDGLHARRGRVHDDLLEVYLSDPYFAAPPPKSLDRYDFSLEPVARLSLDDAAATLTAFAARAAALAVNAFAGDAREVIVAGGGRRNPTLMASLQATCRARVVNADALGWRGDAVEAEAFAFLAARHVRGLPLSFPKTTGVTRPLTGGRLARP